MLLVQLNQRQETLCGQVCSAPFGLGKFGGGHVEEEGNDVAAVVARPQDVAPGVEAEGKDAPHRFANPSLKHSTTQQFQHLPF